MVITVVHALQRMKNQIAEQQAADNETEVLSKEEAMRRFMARRASTSSTVDSGSQPKSAEALEKMQQENARKKELAEKLIKQQGGKNAMVLQRFLERKGLKRDAPGGSESEDSSSAKRQQAVAC
jgi:hypothetical protein